MKIWKKDYYEKMFRNRAKTVNDYQLIIAHAQEQIQKIQAACKHEQYKVGFWSWRPGAMSPSRICTECWASIPGITEEESKRLWDLHNAETYPSDIM